MVWCPLSCVCQNWKFHELQGRGSCAKVCPYKSYSENTLFLLNLLLYSGAWFIQTMCIVIMTEEGSTKIVNFMTSGLGVLVLRCGHMSYMVKIHHFFKNLSLYSEAQIWQTEGIIMMSKEGSTKFINFMTPRAGILVLGRGLVKTVKPHYSFMNLLLFTQA